MTLYPDFLNALRNAGFEGDLSDAMSDRMVLATDNSIYQVLAQAVAFPRSTADLQRIARLLTDPRFGQIVLRPRGGGTGTNGQSLGAGLVVDCSRHMTGILEINAAERWVRVQPGVIKDHLNAALAPYGLFFAPELSTSSRATIGGMISTDACGQGSCMYGKTSDHVLAVTAVLPGGEVMHTGAHPPEALPGMPGHAGEIMRALHRIATDQADLIAERFPKMNRSLTGYDLAHIRRPDGRIDAGAVICGAEGTLALIAEARLNVLPIPKLSALVNIFYDDFQSALRDARVLATMGATSVETIDSRVLGLARADVIWRDVAAFFPDTDAKGVTLVELTGESQAQIDAAIARLQAELANRINGRRGHSLALGDAVGRIWAMRKKAVGLLGKAAGPKRPLPFVEDCAVPPEELEAFIAGFRAILDAEGLDYGMFGHVDAGVLHVRPALDLTDPAQEPLIRKITEAVQTLARKHGGLLWGEHGKGVRSEFVPAVFGPLYPFLQEIKRAFDPGNQMNPGKIATPDQSPLMQIDGVALRGQADRQIAPATRAAFAPALACNGNGACFAQSAAEIMCPSYKATGDRRHSPKGRAGLVREWLRQGGPEGRADPQFEAEVKTALDGCLSCRACARGCPAQVDVPAFRVKFMESWFRRHRRPPSDHALAALEPLLPLGERLRPLFNLAVTGPGAALMRRLGLHHLPVMPALNLRRALAQRGIRTVGATLPDPATSVVIVPDAFTRFFEPQLVLDMADLVTMLGFQPWIARYHPSGKPLHVLGRLSAFRRTARRQKDYLDRLSASGLTLVGIEPAVTLSYGDDYHEALGTPGPQVLLPQEWLAGIADRIPQLPANRQRATLLPHCTEATLRPGTGEFWADIFARAGVTVSLPKTGCCGMAGTWGHEVRNEAVSSKIFAQNWAGHVTGTDQIILATGFSCRCQTALRAGVQITHPITLLKTCLSPS
ncbi:FAD-binding and (Fe-S)-binding domain-containing protein [Pseudotabrizicola alkalilacus]|uniref:D-2-hydroxyglutarate dehydrogenase n=1 Tax=Pseudotabrizicola alkalilacus TaxID=2305252 RepID=A0A411YX19_9RHOB|nr:FAD-binding and (Fe-S)-binding domain-containing protein [Pseudotabrizicola alkalilacus]RGP35289.1 FAD-binding oxidoreductase [Pseudotabrizicola alkalilacus]